MKRKIQRAIKKFGLTKREAEIFILLLNGKMWKTAAAELGISEHTVDFHVRNILAKVGAHSCSEFFSKACQ